MTKAIPTHHGKQGRNLLLAAVLIAATMTASTPAFASYSNATCTVSNVGYSSTGSAAYIAIICGGITYVAWDASAPSGCVSTTVDALKTWMSLAQAAVLSGKSLGVYYNNTGNTCSGYNSIFQLNLLQ